MNDDEKHGFEIAIQTVIEVRTNCLCGHFDHCNHGEEKNMILRALREKLKAS